MIIQLCQMIPLTRKEKEKGNEFSIVASLRINS